MRGKAKNSQRAPQKAAPAPKALAPLAGKWLTRGTDGRLSAFALSGRQLLRWTENRPGGPDWTGPESFALPAGLDRVTVAQGANGYLHLLGRRTRKHSDDRTLHELMYSVQYQSGRPPMEWRVIGNPYKHFDKRHPKIGFPTGAVDGAGILHVFVRNAGRGLHLLTEDKGGKWNPWVDLRGSALHEGVTVGVTSKGRIGVLAPSDKPAHHWQQAVRGGEFERLEDVPVSMVPGSGVGLETSEDQLTYYVSDARSGGLMAIRPNGSVVPIGGAPDQGAAPCALRTDVDGQDCTVIVHRGLGGSPVFGAFVTNAEEWGVEWAEIGQPCAGDPAVALDGNDRIVLALFGTDGVLRLSRQSAGEGLALGAWQAV
ncbi:hypothetical protein OK074_0108 [Actinobacteria bacterium OK074]|nr:hypothetical protein OK074_0108 [Actinobacteria bacterium OK074]